MRRRGPTIGRRFIVHHFFSLREEEK